jgi:hypothetical protein
VEEGIVKTLLDFGGLGIALGVLFYLHMRSTKACEAHTALQIATFEKQMTQERERGDHQLTIERDRSDKHLAVEREIHQRSFEHIIGRLDGIEDKLDRRS